MNGSLLQGIVELLQAGGAADGNEQPSALRNGRLAALGALGLALFGAANGLATGGEMIAVAAAKSVAVAAATLLLCAPSLVVLAALAGATWSDATFGRILLRLWATIGVALAALAPISFLFATSSRYLGSVVLTAALFQVGAALLGRRLIAESGAGGPASGLWIALVLIVAFQIQTLARPMLVRAHGESLLGFERRGFVEQLERAAEIRLDQANEDPATGAPDGESP